jgi:hypothetical protein
MDDKKDQMINRIKLLMEKDDSFDAPKEAVVWAKNLYRARIPEPQKSLVSKIKAVLQMQIQPNEFVYGERSTAASDVRQMLFTAGENSVDLRLSKANKGVNIAGQILGEGFAGSEISLGKFKTVASELSEFKFASVSPGKYDLVIRSGDREIVIEELEIG